MASPCLAMLEKGFAFSRTTSRGFVLSQSLKGRMAALPIGRPFGCPHSSGGWHSALPGRLMLEPIPGPRCFALKNQIEARCRSR
jgi:hypothetical protein